MRALDCTDVRELAPEFAFGVLDGDARADVVHHIDGCATCRSLVTDLSETADSVVLLAPVAEPPPGFEGRALDAMLGSDRRRRWRTVKLVAVAAAAAAIVSVATVRIVDDARAPSAPVAAPAVETVPMVGAGGEAVGTVDVVGDGSTAALSVTTDYALPDGAYRLVVDPAEGAKQGLGVVQVVGGHGAWSGTAELTGPAKLQMLDAAGQVRCSADLPTS